MPRDGLELRKRHDLSQPHRKHRGDRKLNNSSYSKHACSFPSVQGNSATRFWLQQSNYELFAHFPLMNQLNEPSVKCWGSESLPSSCLQTLASLKVPRSDFRAPRVWVTFLNEVRHCTFQRSCQLSPKPTALIHLIPQVSL